jgi:type I restriction enzyme R subunit
VVDELVKLLKQFADSLDNRALRERLMITIEMIRNGEITADTFNLTYPVKLDDTLRHQVISTANEISENQSLTAFQKKWGLGQITSNGELKELFSQHKYGKKDMNNRGEVEALLRKASADYSVLALDNEVKGYSKIKYRNELRAAIYSLADKMLREESE